MLYIVFCFTCTKVKGSSTSLKDFIAKNGQVNAVTMKDVVDACCNAEHETIDVNMEAATTVGNIKEIMYANGKDETDLPRVPDRLVGTSKSDMGINAIINTCTVFAATAIDVVQLKGMISFIFFVEQFQMPMEFFLISNRLFNCICEIVNLFSLHCILCCMLRIPKLTIAHR